MRHRHRKEVDLSAKLSSSSKNLWDFTQWNPTTVSVKYLFGEAKIAYNCL